MTTDRELIQRLVDIADTLNGRKPLVFSQGQAMDGFTSLANFQALANEARALLSQPEPEGLTDEELLRCYGLAKRDHCYEGPIDDWPNRAERAATVHGLRAVIAAVLARWGRAAVEPPQKPAHSTAQHDSQRP